MSDSGLVDIDLEGITIRVKWKSPRQEHFQFYLRRVNCYIDYCRVHFHEAKHK